MMIEQDFKARDAESYDELAASFDRHTELYSTYVIDHLLTEAAVDRATDVIDIGSGSGIVALAAAHRLKPGARVTGVDLSDGMLAFAAAKAARLGVTDRVDFVKGDAEALDLDAGSFDAAVSLYAWRHLPNPRRATAEVFRVLRPGGRFVVAVGSGPKLFSPAGVRAALARPLRGYARTSGRELSACDHIDRLVDQLLPVTDGQENAAWTTHHHAFSGSMTALVVEAGFRITANDWIGREFEITSADDFWDLQATFSSTARKRIADAPVDQVAVLRAEFARQCAATRERGGRLVYRVGAAIVSAVKP